jgi:hypothetical protein
MFYVVFDRITSTLLYHINVIFCQIPDVLRLTLEVVATRAKYQTKAALKNKKTPRRA